MRILFPLLALLVLVGCGKVTPSKNPEMVEITGSVTMRNQPIDSVVLNLQAISGGAMATLPVQQGKVKGAVMPGKYTYFISESARTPAAIARIPKQYQAGSLDRQIEIASGTTLDIKLD